MKLNSIEIKERVTCMTLFISFISIKKDLREEKFQVNKVESIKQ